MGNNGFFCCVGIFTVAVFLLVLKPPGFVSNNNNPVFFFFLQCPRCSFSVILIGFHALTLVLVQISTTYFQAFYVLLMFFFVLFFFRIVWLIVLSKSLVDVR